MRLSTLHVRHPVGACLFCEKTGPFTTVEHIVPASLGNDTDILEGRVCDTCQNYLAREVEGPALSRTPFGFWRAYLGTLTKKGKLPSISMKPPAQGAVPSEHPLSQNYALEALQDGSAELRLFEPDEQGRNIGDSFELKTVLSPWHLQTMGRLLGKIGLEYLAMADFGKAQEPEFDLMREYVRRGGVRWVWPIYFGTNPSGKNLISYEEISGDPLNVNRTVEAYRHSLGITQEGKMVFAFAIGLECYLVCLSKDMPDPSLESLVEGQKMVCAYYNEFLRKQNKAR